VVNAPAAQSAASASFEAGTARICAITSAKLIFWNVFHST